MVGEFSYLDRLIGQKHLVNFLRCLDNIVDSLIEGLPLSELKREIHESDLEIHFNEPLSPDFCIFFIIDKHHVILLQF